MSEINYSAEAVNPFRFEDRERHETALREVAETITFTSERGQHFSGIHVNRDFVESGEPLAVRPNSMFGDSQGADQKYIAYQEAAAFPNRSFVVIDQPAHGSSDILSPEQEKAIKDSGDLSLVARAHVEAVNYRVPNAKKLIVTGEGVGASMAAEFAGEAQNHDLEVLQMFGFDTPGLEQRHSAGLGLGYLLSVLKSRNLYKSGEANKKLISSFNDFQWELASHDQIYLPTPRTEARVFKRQRSLVTFLFKNSPLVEGRTAETLDRVLENDDRMAVNLVFGGLSVVGRLNNTTWEQLTALKGKHEGRLNWEVWRGDDQGIGYAHQRPRLIAYTQDHLNDQP